MGWLEWWDLALGLKYLPQNYQLNRLFFLWFIWWGLAIFLPWGLPMFMGLFLLLLLIFLSPWHPRPGSLVPGQIRPLLPRWCAPSKCSSLSKRDIEENTPSSQHPLHTLKVSKASGRPSPKTAWKGPHRAYQGMAPCHPKDSKESDLIVEPKPAKREVFPVENTLTAFMLMP